MIWLMPVLALVCGSVLVGGMARRVQREVDATSVVVDRAIDALGGVSDELGRAQQHLDRLGSHGTNWYSRVRRRRRRPVPSTS